MDLKIAVDSYSQATAEFLSVASQLTESELDASKTRGWTPRQVIHHVADSEAQSYARLRRLIAEPGTEIQGYDEAGWGANETLGYEVLPVGPSLDVFNAVRASSLEIIKRLKPEQLANSGIHTESGSYSLSTWLETYISHPLEHAAQIKSG
jgi:DinB superfamily